VIFVEEKSLATFIAAPAISATVFSHFFPLPPVESFSNMLQGSIQRRHLLIIVLFCTTSKYITKNITLPNKVANRKFQWGNTSKYSHDASLRQLIAKFLFV